MFILFTAQEHKVTDLHIKQNYKWSFFSPAASDHQSESA